MAFYLLNTDGGRIMLSDNSGGAIELEEAPDVRLRTMALGDRETLRLAVSTRRVSGMAITDAKVGGPDTDIEP